MTGHHFTLTQPNPDGPIPGVAENVGPYASLDDALAAWPAFTHETTAEEWDLYEGYWDGWHVAHEGYDPPPDLTARSDAYRRAYEMGLNP